ncbi:MAG TPA: exodeoxyribonuclease VII small subunit [Candidatus Saccharimonadales bacterium]|nr:exodeoxyribonuclease VII small subunit [Candidatus Saccharimonadales bacterium]
MTAKKLDYQGLSDELETVLLTLQQEDVDVDTAMAAYERGLKLVGQLEAYLSDAENTVKKLQAASDNG